MSALVADPDGPTFNGGVSMRIVSHARLGQRTPFTYSLGNLLCARGPESNCRHVVLQTIALPTEMPRRDIH